MEIRRLTTKNTAWRDSPEHLDILKLLWLMSTIEEIDRYILLRKYLNEKNIAIYTIQKH